MQESTSQPQLNFPVSAELDALIRSAAESQGISVSEFVTRVLHAASVSVMEGRCMLLSGADQDAFVEALLSPPKPSAALERAFVANRRLLRDQETE